MYISRKREQLLKILWVFLLGLVIYHELVVFMWHSLNWPKVRCGETKEFYKILLVADPQILGEKSESFVARWDSDRYLMKTFSLAVQHSNPDVIIFLGDLMDEGSIATSQQHSRYLKRFHDIFTLDRMPLNTSLIFLPGDNDIGGEDEEVTSYKVRRYYKSFNQGEHLQIHNLHFIKINKMLKTFPDMSQVVENNGDLRVMLSHVPVFGIPSYFATQALAAIKPDLVFSAHDHKSVHFVGESSTGQRAFVEELEDNPYADHHPTWRFKIDKLNVNEIVVPTCSYRMGTQQIAFGLALIDKKGESFCYNVLWLPDRLNSLIIYLLTVPPIFVVMLVTLFCRCRRGRRLFSSV